MPNYAIIGATGGVGSTLSQKLINEGGNVFPVARNEEKLKYLQKNIGHTESYLLQDISFEEIDKALQTAADCLGTLDGVVDCIGSILLKPAHLTREDEWGRVILTNLTSSIAVVRSSANQMFKSGGSIVLFSSAAALIGLPNHEAIAAAKGGVIGLTRSAAATYSSKKIRINCIAPGLIQTSLTERITNSPVALKNSLSLHPIGRIGEPKEVASFAQWLLSKESSWVTGQVYPMDGGLSSIK